MEKYILSVFYNYLYTWYNWEVLLFVLLLIVNKKMSKCISFLLQTLFCFEMKQNKCNKDRCSNVFFRKTTKTKDIYSRNTCQKLWKIIRVLCKSFNKLRSVCMHTYIHTFTALVFSKTEYIKFFVYCLIIRTTLGLH